MGQITIDPKRTILFAGAGISVPLGLPSWDELISEIGRQLDFDPRVFKLYGTPLSLAEYFVIKRGSIGPLRSWMDVAWHSNVDITKSPLHEKIVKAGFKKIYTTNYDRWIERACEHWGVIYRKVVSVNDIGAVRPGELEIVKFHGDFDNDETLVLTESSYFSRMDFQSPLDVMLRADVLRYSVLFIGYSLTDINMRYLFHKVSDIWRMVPDKTARPPVYIFMVKPNPVAEAAFIQWGITPILISGATSPDGGLVEFIDTIGKA